MEGSDDMANNAPYIDALLKAFDDKVQVKNLYIFFKHRNIKAFNATTDRVITELYSEMKVQSMPNILKYFINEGSIYKEYSKDNGVGCTSRLMYMKYSEWCTERKWVTITENIFAKKLNTEPANRFVMKGGKDCVSGSQLYIIDQSKLDIYISKTQVDYTKKVVYDTFPEKYIEFVDDKKSNKKQKV